MQITSPHTDDSTVIQVINERVLFIGDANCGEFPTWVKDKELTERFVGDIASIDVDMCMEGHWTPDTKQGIRETIEKYICGVRRTGRSSAMTGYAVFDSEGPRVQYCPPGTYTIVEVRNGQGSSSGWGRLKSGIGWISLEFVDRV